MPTPPRFAVPLLAVLIAAPAATAGAQSSEQQERVGASFVLALGRVPTAGEAAQWAALQPVPLAALIARHRRELQGDAAAQRAVTIKASVDALGVAPGGAESVPAVPKAGAAGGRLYADVMNDHLRWLAGHPADYVQVLHRAYRLLLQRDAYPVEVDYWKGQPPLSYALLVGCIEDWARRNRPGLTATSGVASVSVNSEYLATVRLSPALALEARAAAGLPAQDDAALASAAWRRVAAPGADRVASVGGIHFTAAGAPSLASSLEAR